MDLTTNGVIITDAIKFVQNSKDKVNQSSSSQEDEESKEPDYNNEDSKGEEEQEKGTGEISESEATTNQVF